MGRHSSTTQRKRRSPIIVLSILLVVGLVGWLAVALIDRLKPAGCDSTTVINVVAASDIAPTITQAGRRVSEQGGDDCYKVNVSSRESAAVAESLVVSDGTERPDVWIPESTMWLQRAQDKGAWNTPVNGASIANSPVVMALTDAAATELGWPAAKLTWSQLIGPAPASLAVGLPDPARDPVGVATLFGLRDLIKNTPDPGGASTAAMRRLSPNTESLSGDLFNRLPGGNSPAEPLAAFPTSENALLKHNVKHDESKLVAVYADPPVPSLDYPYVVLPDTPDAKRTAAGKFLEQLLNQQTSDELADAGFRTPDGKALRDRSQDKRTSSAPLTPIQAPDAAEVEQLLNNWAAVNLSGRVQVLLDVSGSMAQPVPGTGKTRLEVTLQAATAGVGLFKQTTKIGWWLYSTNMAGGKPYTVLLPMRTVSEQLAAGALDTLRGVKVNPNGNTAMYDTVLAAYQDARQNWEPGRINVVVLMTDGKDDNASGIKRDQLIAELKKLQDPKRPLLLIGIGIGPDVDPAELKAISEATGGEAFVNSDPAKIGDVFYAALSKMLCQPPTCKPANGGG
jgi:Bacterial extracellular solute-binding protein/von Willebrand factor type A domain